MIGFPNVFLSLIYLVVMVMPDVSAFHLFPMSSFMESTRISKCTDSKDMRQFCIGTEPYKPGPVSNEKRDSSSYLWETPTSNIVPVEIESYKSRPELITFSLDALIEPSQSIGRWLREILNIKCVCHIKQAKEELIMNKHKMFADFINCHTQFFQ